VRQLSKEKTYIMSKIAAEMISFISVKQVAFKFIAMACKVNVTEPNLSDNLKN
jgi:hypothetical protein